MQKNFLYQSLVLCFIINLCSVGYAQGNNFDDAVSFYYQNEMDKALEVFNALSGTQNSDAELYAWIAQTNFRSGKLDQAEKYGKLALQIDECNSFAHTVIGAAMLQASKYKLNSTADSSWIHLIRAVDCDSTNCNAWCEIWSAAWGLNKLNLANKAISKLRETGFLTTSTLSFGRWLLSYLPENAIIITSGDMDTYPMLALQLTENFRRDIIVIEKEWLDIDWTLRNIKNDYKLPIYFEDEKLGEIYKEKKNKWGTTADTPVLNRWIENLKAGIFNHRIAFSVTVGQEYLAAIENNIKYCGPYFLLNTTNPKDSIDIKILGKSVDQIKISTFAGPWTSERDLSPIRRQYTKYLILNISAAALNYSDELIKQKQFSKAKTILDFIEKLESESELGLFSKEEIQKRRSLF